MSLVRAGVFDNGIMRMPQPGDLIANSEAIITLGTVGTAALTGANLTSGILSRTGSTGAYADTFPTATDLISALQSLTYAGSGANTPLGVQANLSFRLRILNQVAFVDTLSANTGVTLSGTMAIPASSWKDFLILINNGNPPFVASLSTTNGSNVLTNLMPTQAYGVNLNAIVSGTGIPAGSYVTGVNANGTVTINQNATVTGASVALTFSPSYTVFGLGGGAL